MTPELVKYLIFNFNSHIQIILQKGPNISHNLQNILTFHFRHRHNMFEVVVDAGEHLLTMPYLHDLSQLRHFTVLMLKNYLHFIIFPSKYISMPS